MNRKSAIHSAAAAALSLSPAMAQPFFFSNQTDAAGLAFTHTHADNAPFPFVPAGGAAADFNNDGWTDLFVLGGGLTSDALFINNGPGPDGQVSFTDRAAEWGIDQPHHSFGVAAADYDNDGDIDLYITSFGPGDQPPVPDAHILYRNDGGRFTNIAAAAGVNSLSPGIIDGTGSAWGDVDLDGDLDLLVGGWVEGSGANTVFLNNGPGLDGQVTFTDATDIMLPDMSAVRGFVPGMFDMTGDRYPELLWVADFSSSRYLVCDGPDPRGVVTFSDVTDLAHDLRSALGMGSAIGDLDRDGQMDWYVSSIHYPPPRDGPGNLLMLRKQAGGFDNIAKSSADNVRNGYWGWGVLIVDLDHDGWPDLVETNGWTSRLFDNKPGQLFHNQGDGLTYAEVAAQSGFDHSGQGRGLINFDADNDGDEDLVVFSHAQPLAFYRNDLLTPGQAVPPGSAWLRVDLDTSKRDTLAPAGIGSTVTATIDALDRAVPIDSGFNFCSSGEVGAHIGLGSAATIDALRIAWNDGSFTTLVDVEANQRLTITAPFHPADLDDSGVVDAGDINRFVSDFITGSLTADQDGSGSLDFFDVFRFLTDYANAP